MNTNTSFPSNREEIKSYNILSWRETFVLTILRFGCLVGIPLLIIAFPTATFSDRVVYTLFYLLLVGVSVAKVSYLIRAYVFTFILFIVGVLNLFILGTWSDANVFFVTSVFLSAIFLDNQADIFVLVGSVLASIIFGALQLNDILQIRTQVLVTITLIDWAIYIVDFAVMSTFIVLTIRQFKKSFIGVVQEAQTVLTEISSERNTLEEKVYERTKALELRMSQLHNTTLTTRAIASVQNIAELLENTASLISEKFGYYHVGLYVIDTQKNIGYLQASSSTTGKLLIGQGISLDLDRKNPLAMVVQQNRFLIMSDVDQRKLVADDSFPLTRSRLVLPLSVRGNVIGLLDLHSDQPQVFTTDDAEVLQHLADLTAITFDNIRLLDDTKILVSQLEASTSLQTQRIWSKITSRQNPIYQYTPAGVRPVFHREKEANEEAGLNIPLRLHGQSIGILRLKRKNTNAEWSEREKVLVEKIADQVALALENSRLVEEAQKNAVRDQMIASVSTRIRETLDLDSVARTAASELRRVFDLKEAEIVVGITKLDETA